MQHTYTDKMRLSRDDQKAYVEKNSRIGEVLCEYVWITQHDKQITGRKKRVAHEEQEVLRLNLMTMTMTVMRTRTWWGDEDKLEWKQAMQAKAGGFQLIFPVADDTQMALYSTLEEVLRT